LNLHGLRHTHLKRACIPISTRRQNTAQYYTNIAEAIVLLRITTGQSAETPLTLFGTTSPEKIFSPAIKIRSG